MWFPQISLNTQKPTGLSFWIHRAYRRCASYDRRHGNDCLRRRRRRIMLKMAYHLRLLTHPLCCFCTPAPPRRESGIVDFVLHSYKDFTVRWYLYHREGVFPSALQRCCVASGICAAFLFCAFSEERATYTMMLCSRGYNFTVKIGWCNALHRGRLTLCLDFARQLFEGLTVGDSSMLLAISKANSSWNLVL